MTLSRIVLVHGGHHGAWCWDTLTPLLEARGYEAEAVDLPGCGDDRTPPAEATLDAAVDRVIQVVSGKPGPVLLVGHSMGGQTVSQVAENIPDRIGKIVYISAFLPRSGDSLGAFLNAKDDSVHDDRSPGEWALGNESATHTVDPDTALDLFYNTCDPEVAARAVARLRPQPHALLAGVATLSDARFGAIPKTYVVSLRDNVVHPQTQRQLAARARHVAIVEIDSDHSPFYSAAPELAALLDAECTQLLAPASTAE